MSMDASSNRFAVAALMDGRMGLLCDLQHGNNTGRPSLDSKAGQQSNFSVFTTHLGPGHNSRLASETEREHVFSGGGGSNDEGHLEPFNAINVRADRRTIDLINVQSDLEGNVINQTWNLRMRGGAGPSGRSSVLPEHFHSRVFSSPESSFLSSDILTHLQLRYFPNGNTTRHRPPSTTD